MEEGCGTHDLKVLSVRWKEKTGWKNGGYADWARVPKRGRTLKKNWASFWAGGKKGIDSRGKKKKGVGHSGGKGPLGRVHIGLKKRIEKKRKELSRRRKPVSTGTDMGENCFLGEKRRRNGGGWKLLSEEVGSRNGKIGGPFGIF